MLHLRRGETLRRLFEPGLEDGRTYVYWGQNLNQGGIPGPARPQTWVNQPEKMYQSKVSSPYKDGRARFANAVYTYAPNFATADYKEGVIDVNERQGHHPRRTDAAPGPGPHRRRRLRHARRDPGARNAAQGAGTDHRRRGPGRIELPAERRGQIPDRVFHRRRQGLEAAPEGLDRRPPRGRARRFLVTEPDLR